jgi:hypothetical protein
MLTFNLIIAVALFILAAGLLYGWYRNSRREKLNEYVAKELTDILDHTKNVMSKQKALSHGGVHRQGGYEVGDPALLATLVTVIVNKYGNLRLGLDDFVNVPDGEFVTLYVDTATSDLILSLNHALTHQEASTTIYPVSDPDDGTFH